MTSRFHVIIAGGGASGLLSAYYLTQAGFQVTVFEKNSETGGLYGLEHIKDFEIERYYHHLMRSDTHAISAFDDLGIANTIKWRRADAFFHNGAMAMLFSSIRHVLACKALSVPARLSYLAGFAKIIAIRNPKGLGNVDVVIWARRIFGAEASQKFWEPLLAKRFKNYLDKVPAVWLWQRIRKRLDNVTIPGTPERLGYPRQGYGDFFLRLKKAVTARGGRIETNARVLRIIRKGKQWTVETPGQNASGHAVILAMPFAHACMVDISPKPKVRRLWEKVPYLGTVEVMVISRKPVTKGYWTNVTDPYAPFCGVIEHTWLEPPVSYGNRHILYLTEYADRDDPIWRRSETQVRDLFLKHLARLYPGFSENNVIEALVFRNRFTHAVRDAAFIRNANDMYRPLSGLFCINDSLIFPDDRGLDVCAKIAKQVKEDIDRLAGLAA